MKENLCVICTCLCLFFCISCTNKQSNSSELNKAVPSIEGAGKEIDVAEKQNSQPEIKVIASQYRGVVAHASVNDDNVSIRLMPNISSEKVDTLNKGDIVEIRGFSYKRELIDGYEGYWLKVTIGRKLYAGSWYKVSADKKFDEYYASSGSFGWVFSKYINIDPKLDVSTLKVIGINPKTDRTAMTLNLEINRNGEKIETKISPSKMKNQNFYTFVWTDDISKFSYSDPAGTFKWNPDTNEIQHITYMGSDAESAWCLVSDDNKYLFQDFGTCPGVRGLMIYEISTTKRVFGGSHLGDLDYDGNSVIIVEACTRWNIENKEVSEESIRYAEEYKKQLSKEELEAHIVVVRYRYYLETRERKFFDCKTILDY